MIAVRAAAFAAVLLLFGCSKKPEIQNLTEEFVYTALALSPVSAAAAGLHEHQGVSLDEQLDDVSAAAFERRRSFYASFADRLKAIDKEALDAHARADYEILENETAAALLEYDRIRHYRKNPTYYVELIGSALFNPFVVEYAPLEQRYRHIIARLERIPVFLQQASATLESAPEVWTTVAIVENEGNIALIEKTLSADVPPNVAKRFRSAAAGAVGALRQFNSWMRHNLAARPADWRLGADLYPAKFRHSLSTDRSPQEVLAEAEDQIRSVRSRMYELAVPLHTKWFPDAKQRGDAGQVISETLGRIAENHATPQTYFANAKRDLREAREFVAARNLVPLPPARNLEVIETPEFMRGVYAVGGFNSAPALQPQLGAFYWLTPISDASMLREYNEYGLKLLTIHEAMPGHYVQFEYANQVQPVSRRLLRSVYGNGPYIEGWAVYATEMLIEQGFLNSSPELQLTFLKQQLRILANAILDIRLHTVGMTDQQALDLMQREAFQETGEATAKLRRAKLSAAQLPAYYVGWREWSRILAEQQKRSGNRFDLAAFHKKALSTGAVPLTSLPRLLD